MVQIQSRRVSRQLLRQLRLFVPRSIDTAILGPLDTPRGQPEAIRAAKQWRKWLRQYDRLTYFDLGTRRKLGSHTAAVAYAGTTARDAGNFALGAMIAVLLMFCGGTGFYTVCKPLFLGAAPSAVGTTLAVIGTLLASAQIRREIRFKRRNVTLRSIDRHFRGLIYWGFPLALILLGELLAFHEGPKHGAAAYAMITTGLFLGAENLAFAASRRARLRLSRSWGLSRPEAAVSVLLLLAMDDVANNKVWRIAIERKAIIRRIEHAAWFIEHGLPLSASSGERAHDGWLVERARVAAASVRELKKWAATPGASTQTDLVVKLREYVSVTANGRWNDLHDGKPAALPPIPTRFQQAMSVARSIVASLAPLAVVAAVKFFFAKPNDGAFSWLLVLTTSWAAANLILIADPLFAARLDAVRKIMETPLEWLRRP